MKVSEIMTPWPAALPFEAPLAEAARLMRDQGVDDVLVTSGGWLCGLVTGRDIVVRAMAEERDGARTSLGDVCSADLVTVAPDDDAEHAADLMRRQSVRRLPVVAGGLPVGIVAAADLEFALVPAAVPERTAAEP